jgi:hypothetical protein
MKPERRLLMAKTKGFLVAAVFLCGVLCLSGCVTNKVLELRRDRETRVKEATNFWSLAAVRSGHVVSGGDAFACVEFRDSPGDTPQANTINLSQASRIGRTFSDIMPASYGRIGSDHGFMSQSGLDWYLYPLLEAQKGCGNTAGESPFPDSALKIETLQIRREDQPRLPEILHSLNSGTVDQGQLIEVRFEPEERPSESLGAEDVLMVYLPPDKSSEYVQPIGIAGAFEPGSEWVNPYTLLVVPAVAADTAIITTIIMLGGLRYR